MLGPRKLLSSRPARDPPSEQRYSCAGVLKAISRKRRVTTDNVARVVEGLTAKYLRGSCK